jgi:hypothetical protein
MNKKPMLYILRCNKTTFLSHFIITLPFIVWWVLGYYIHQQSGGL